MSDPKMEQVSLTGLMDGGVLMAANERFFWPLGLALTWTFDSDTGEASNLHVTQWSHEPGELERIETAHDDEVAHQRRDAFRSWLVARLADMRPSEQPVARPPSETHCDEALLMFTIGREELMRNIAEMGAARCLYNAFGGVEAWLSPSHRCDCKYGPGKSEGSGCPELSSAYRLLAAMNDIEYAELRRAAGMMIVEEDLGDTTVHRCPTCGSKNPAWHPAVQFEGEVSLCADPWHSPTKEEIEVDWAERQRRKRNEHVIEGLRDFFEAPADIQHDVLRLRPDLALRLKRVARELGR